MFCTKCGQQLPDDAFACSACGAQLRARPQPSAPAQPQFQQQYQQPYQAPVRPAAPAQLPAFIAKKPSVLSYVCSFLAFMFAILPVFYYAVSYSGIKLGGGRFSMFTSGIFGTSGAAGVAMIMMDIAIVIFITRFVWGAFKLDNVLKLSISIEAILQLAFLFFTFLSLFLGFIAAVSTNGLTLWIWWYFAFLSMAGGCVFTFLPNIGPKN